MSLEHVILLDVYNKIISMMDKSMYCEVAMTFDHQKSILLPVEA